MISDSISSVVAQASKRGWPVLARTFEATFLLFLATIAADGSWATGNVVEYSYDAAGNIVQVKRQSTSGLSISGFTPSSGAVGTSITILGSGFSATPANNSVQFNGVAATVTAADTGSLAVTVPTGATTGRISVTVGAATATSAQDFTVVIPGAPTIASFSPASGAAGTTVAVTGTNFDIAAGGTTVKLNGVTATANVTTATDLTFTVPGAVATGRITATTSLGTGTSATDFNVPPPGINAADIVATLRLPPDGTYANLVVSTPSKYGLLLFDGAADTYYTLQFSQFATSPTSATISYQVVKPDNTVLATGTVGNTNRPTIHVPKLPVAGTYSVLVSAGSATLNTYARVSADPVLSIDGAAAASSMDFSYQSMRFVFAAAASQRIGIGVMGVSLTPSSSNSMGFTAYLPNGTAMSTTTLPSCAVAGGSNPEGNCDGELLTTVAGTYALVAQSPASSYAAFTVQLSNEVTGTLAVDLPQSVVLSRVGQDTRYTFSAVAGDSLAIDVSDINPQPRPQSFYAWMYRPDGSPLMSCSGMPPAGAYCELGAISVAGTYSVLIDPWYGAYGSLKLALKQGPMLAATDPPTAFAPSGVSESARFRFAGTAGQNATLGITDFTATGTGSLSATLYVYRPDGVQLSPSATCTPSSGGGTCKLTLSNLPVGGTYSVVVRPAAGVKVTGNISLSSDLTGTLVTGTPVSLNAVRAGQNARYSFTGTAGDSTSVKLLGASTAPAGQRMNVSIYSPSGAYLTFGYATSPSAVFVNLGSLPTTGTYTIVVEPYYGATWQGQLVLDPGTALTVDGAVATLTAGATGEPLRFPFTGTAGQRIDVGLSGLAYAAASSSSSTLTIYRPDGSSVVSLTCYTSGTGSCDSSYLNLPVTGIYSVLITPPGTSAIAAGSLAISTPLAGTFVVGDPAQTVALSRPGQTARFTFAGTAAQLLRLNWTGTTVSGGANVSVSVLKPDGTTLSSGSFLNGATGGLDIASLPTTGAYTIVFDPASAATMTAPVALLTR